MADGAAARIGLVLLVRRFGAGPGDFWRRLAEVHEIDAITDGRPRGRLLHCWDEGSDRFATLDAPVGFGGDPRLQQACAAALRALVEAGRTSRSDLAALVDAGACGGAPEGEAGAGR